MTSRKKHLLLFIGLLVLLTLAGMPVSGAAAGPELAWNMTLESRIFDEWYDVAPCPDGSFFLVGSMQDYNRGHYGGRYAAWEHGGYHWGRDISLARLGADGTVLWSREIGKLNDDCAAFSVEATPEGRYLISGVHRIGEADWDLFLMEADAGGTMQWMKHYGGLADDWATASCITNDGFHVMAGGTNSYGSGGSDVYVIKTSLNGAVVWKKAFGGPQDEWAASVCPGEDGGIIVAAVTSSFGSGKKDIWILFLDADGNLLRETVVGGGYDDWPSCIAPSADGGYIVAGGTKSFGSGKSDVFLVKTDARGVVEWQKAIGGSEAEWASSIAGGSAGGYCLAGVSLEPGDGKADVLVMMVDERGEPAGDLQFGSISGDWVNAVIAAGENRYLVAGAITLEKLAYQEKVDTRIKYLSDNGYYLSLATSPYGEIYGQRLAAMITVPETVQGTFEGGWDDNLYDGTFWEYRIPVYLQETMQRNRTGTAVIIPMRNVFGRNFQYATLNPASLRVVDPDAASPDRRETGGVSVPFTIHDEDADRTLSPDDYLIFRSDVTAGFNRTYYVYYSADPTVMAPAYESLAWNLLENADFEVEDGGSLPAWTPFSQGYTPVLNRSLAGRASLYMQADNPTAAAGASQWVAFDLPESYQSLTFVIWVSGKGINGTASNAFALHPVLIYPDGNRSTQWYRHCDVGTYPWQRYAIEVTPAAPVRHIGYYLLFINHPGSVWFDAAEIFGNVYAVTVGGIEQSTSRTVQEPPEETPPPVETAQKTASTGLFSEPLRSQDLFLLGLAMITLSFIIVIASMKR